MAPLGPALRQAVWSVDPNLPVTTATLAGTLEESLAQVRFTTRLVGVLGGLAVVLAVVGIYAVIAYSVARRRREIGDEFLDVDAEALVEATLGRAPIEGRETETGEDQHQRAANGSRDEEPDAE